MGDLVYVEIAEPGLEVDQGGKHMIIALQIHCRLEMLTTILSR